MWFQNSPAPHHGPASISVMEADWLSDATELLRPVAENRFLLAPARWMSRMSEPEPDRCYWRISFTFFTLNWNSLSHGNEKSLHGSSCKALKTSWIKERKKTKKKQRWITLRGFFSHGAAFPPHTITTLLFTCTAHKQTILNCRYTKLNGKMSATQRLIFPPTLPSSPSVETWNWFDSTCSQVCLCSPLITGGKTNGSAASVLFVRWPSQSQLDYSK